MKNVVIRAISGAVYVALIVVAILLGWPYFLSLITIIALLGIVEYSKVTETQLSFLPLGLDIIGTMAIVASPAMMISDSAPLRTVGITALFCIPIYFIFRIVASLYDMRQGAFLAMAKSMLGVIYVGLPLSALNFLYLSDYKTGPIIVLIMFIMIWLNDTGAFCVGSLVGRHRLYERLSPKKSWEGFFGGALFCIGAGIAAYYIIDFYIMNIALWIGMGIVVCIFSTWGDLFESLLKRSMHVKDSGNLIPGHGGILDRIDSLLLVAPALVIYLLLALSM